MKRSTGRGETLRNRIMLFMGAAVVVLTVIIAVTAPREDKLPSSVASGSDKKSSSVEQSKETQSSDSATTEETASSSTSESKVENEPTGEDKPSSGSKSSVESKSTSESKPATPATAMPMLVNPTNKIPEGYTPDVVEMGNGYRFDRTGTEAYNKMLADAKADGMNLWVVSAYRTTEKQTTNFNNKIKEYQGMGYTAEQAYAATAKLIAVPGTSEHSLGLALDLNSLETSFENTKEFAWLIKHCAEYGFILRYPKDKVEITEISYEPWHYRYVGVEHAKVIMEKGICLEEYLSGDY